jgi:MFS family permease
MSNIGGIIFQFIGGLLGSIGWRYCFLSYSLLIPSLVIILILLRDPPASAPSPLINPPVEQIKPVKGHKLFSVFFVSWSVFYFLYGVLICPIITDTSAVILQSGLGDSTSAGLALTVFTIGGFTGSFSFKYMVKRIYKQAMTLLAILGFAGSVLLIFAYNLPIYVAGAFIFGAGFGISLPAVVLFVGISVKESQKAVAASILLALYSSGNFFSPLLVSWIKTIYGITYIRFSYVLSAVCFAALIIRFIFLKTYAYEREILCPKK